MTRAHSGQSRKVGRRVVAAVPVAVAAAATVAVMAAAVVVAWPGTARACGGFFCNQPPMGTTAPPIAQAAENVVFVLDRDPVTGRGLVEAHVQILYTGDADKFSWVVPMPSFPELGEGHDIVFQLLEPRTRPSFSLQWTQDCAASADSGPGCGGGSASGGAAPKVGPGGQAADAGTAPRVEVAFRGSIGPFDSSVIRSDDAGALEAWLVANQYFVSPEASLVIREYVETGSYFVALRLLPGRDTGEIQPIVLKLGAEEGCLPLKLTAIAATPNLRVNVWVVGAARAVPLLYTEVVVNQAKIDWFTGGANYDRLVADAVDEAGGTAFVTEYARPTASEATGWFVVNPNGAASLAAARDPAMLWNALQALGVPIAGETLQILRTQVPMPARVTALGITEAQFYGSLAQMYQTYRADFAPFDAAAAIAAVEAQVLRPMAAMGAVMSKHRYLTRLATFISPEEMTKDPLFVTNAALPDVLNRNMATAVMGCGSVCDAPVRLQLPGGREVAFRPKIGGATGQTCNFNVPPPYERDYIDSNMPAAQESWRRDPDTAGERMIDNGPAIMATIGSHNIASAGYMRGALAADGDSGGCACATIARHVGRGLGHPAAIAALIAAALAIVAARRPKRRG